MKKSELKTGMIIETRRGDTGLVIKDNCYGVDAVVFTDDNWARLDSYSDDMTWKPNNPFMEFHKGFDIMKVFKPDLPTGFLGRCNTHAPYTPIWERKEVKEHTIQELFDKVGYEFKIKK